jgi:segregation and condensation protein B
MEEFDTPDAGLPQEPPAGDETVSAEDLLAGMAPETPAPSEDAQLRALLEAVVYVTDEPLTLQQMSAALALPPERIRALLDELVAEYDRPEHGLTVREVAGGYKMATKPEHHEAVRNFVKSLKPPLKLSLAALETLSVIAYKQPVTAPEIGEIRGVQGTGVLKTLLDRKLIATAGRKNVIGKPILYKTTKEFLVQFGLKDLSELPTLKEFEEIGRMALGEAETAEEAPTDSEPAQTGEAALAAEPERSAAEPAQAGEPGTPAPGEPAQTGEAAVAAEPERSAAESAQAGEPGTPAPGEPAQTGEAAVAAEPEPPSAGEPAQAGEPEPPAPDPRPPAPGEPAQAGEPQAPAPEEHRG